MAENAGLIMMTTNSLRLRLAEVDKRKHFWVCFFLQFLFLPWFSILLSITLALLVGILKECWDQVYGTGFCWYDMLANVLGIAAGLVAFVALSQVWMALY